MQSFIAPSVVFGAGFVGGFVNALMSGTADITLPGQGTAASAQKIWRPGWIANPIIGGVAALVSWAMYGSGAGASIALPTDLTWANAAAAVLIGIGGTRWLSAEVDKNVFQQTAVTAAQKDKSAALSAVIATGTPAQALRAAIAAPG